MLQDSSAQQQELFSVIVLHYNQEKFIGTALDSVFGQDYSNIELIIADDCTPGLNTEQIVSYIDNHKGPNITNVILQFNAENQGTVRNINKAVQSASGKYVLFFAADDCLWDSHTISNYARALQSLPAEEYVATAQCYMMDDHLEAVHGPFVNVPLAMSLNQGPALVQFQKLAYSCLYAMGATAFKASVWEKFGWFDETYKIIEDWSYFLHLTRQGAKITFFNFGGLKHRDGGVSHYKGRFNQVGLPPHVISYKNDALMIQEREILPYLSQLPFVEQTLLVSTYERHRRAFARLHTGSRRIRRIDLVLRNPKLFTKLSIFSLIKKSSRFRRILIQRSGRLLLAWLALVLIGAAGQSLAGGIAQTAAGIGLARYAIWPVIALLGLNLAAYVLLASLSTVYLFWKRRKDYFATDK